MCAHGRGQETDQCTLWRGYHYLGKDVVWRFSVMCANTTDKRVSAVQSPVEMLNKLLSSAGNNVSKKRVHYSNDSIYLFWCSWTFLPALFLSWRTYKNLLDDFPIAPSSVQTFYLPCSYEVLHFGAFLDPWIITLVFFTLFIMYFFIIVFSLSLTICFSLLPF